MRGALVLLLAAVLAAGCGDDDKKSGGGADAAAKADARNVVAQVEACFADNQDYTRCRDAEEGVARVTQAGPSTFTVVARSESGRKFEIGKHGSANLSRPCRPPGSGGCPEAGYW